jgi:hypothetical protein
MSEQNQPGAQQTLPPAETSKLPKGLYSSLKKAIIETAPQVKDKDGKFVPEPKFVEAVNALKVDDCEVASSKGNIYVVHAGAFGLRKVTL